MSQKYNGFSLGSPAAGDRALLRTELVHGTMHKRMVGIKEHQNTRITEERRRSAQVYERDVVRLELENWCLHPPDGHDYRCVSTVNVHGCVEVPCSQIYDRMSELGE